MMNSTDSFVQLVGKPCKKIEVQSDLHFLKLTAPTDFWDQGGGAYHTKVFGCVGRPGNGHSGFRRVYGISADMPLTKQLSLSACYAHASGISVVGAIYTADRDANYGYFELTYGLQKAASRHAH